VGTFAETATVDYRLSFADKRKQTSVFPFRLQQTNRSLPFPFSVCNNGSCRFSLVPFSDYTRTYTRKTRTVYKCMYTCIIVSVCICIYILGYIIYTHIHIRTDKTNVRRYDEQMVTVPYHGGGRRK
jgi:hypothetical protein